MKLDRRVLSPFLLVLVLIYGILLQLLYCCQYLSLLPSFYETQSIRGTQQNVVVVFFFLILCCSFKFRKKRRLTGALFVNDLYSPKVTTTRK